MTQKYSSAPLGSGPSLGTTTSAETQFPQNNEGGNDSFLRKVRASVNSMASLATVGVFAAMFAGNSAAYIIEFDQFDYSVDEGGVAMIGVQLSCDYSTELFEMGSVSVWYETGDETATAGDYTAVSGELIWDANDCDSTQIFEVSTNDDLDVESNETVRLILDKNTNFPLETQLTILDTDLPTFDFSISDSSVSENVGVATIDVTMTCQTDPNSFPVSASYSTSDGTATAGDDYTAVSGELTWAADGCGITQTFDVPIQNDSEVEGDETVNLSLDGINTAVLTIVNDNSAPLAPTALSTTAVSQTQINLSWIDGSNNETGFKIERDGILIKTTIAGINSFDDTDDTGLICGITYNYSVKATNATGDSDAATASATTQDCPALNTPTFTSEPITEANEGALYTYNISFTDVDGDSLSIRASSAMPEWLTLTDNGNGTATLTGTTPTGTTKIYEIYDVILQIEDGTWTVDQHVFITVKTKAATPTALTANAVSSTQIDLNWADNSSDETGFKIERNGAFIETTADNAVKFNDTGLSCGTTYNYSVKATNVEGDSSAVTTSATTQACPQVTPANKAPTFTSEPITSVDEGAPYTYTITTTDADTGDSLSISAPTKLAWLDLNENGDGTATLTGTPAIANVGSHDVTLQVSDGTVNTEQKFTITVKAKVVAKTPPTAQMSVSPKTGTASLTVNLDGSDSSDSDGEIVAYEWAASDGQSASGTPATMIFDNAGTYDITLKVTDNDGLTATATDSVTVSAKAPPPQVIPGFSGLTKIPEEIPESGLDQSVKLGDGENRVTKDLKIAKGGSVKNAVVESQVTNNGVVYGSRVATGGSIIGSVNSGHTTTVAGTLDGIDFRGYIVNGSNETGEIVGTLAGDIVNNSEIGGYFEDFNLAPGATITGGGIRGIISGDAEKPAVLKDLTIHCDTVLKNVIIGEGVEIAPECRDEVLKGKNVQFADGVKAPSEGEDEKEVAEGVDCSSENSDYEEGREAGKAESLAECQQAGTTANCPRVDTPASFSLSEKSILKIPAVDVPDGKGSFIPYQVEMKLISAVGEKLTFSVTHAEPIQSEDTPPSSSEGPRFTDNKDGTVTDNHSGLIWLKNANCFGMQGWDQAKEKASNLADKDCGLTDGSTVGDWRLPNVKELQSLINYDYYAPALSNAAGTGQWSEGDAFSSVQTYYYWSSTTFATDTGYAWYVNLDDGYVSNDDKATMNYFVWPVRDGQIDN